MAAQIVLEYVCPALGMITANIMFFSPVQAVRKAERDGRLGNLNPTPWAFMLGNCCGWVTYSFLINNLFVFFGNAPGFCLSVWLNLQAIKLQYGDFQVTEIRKSISVALGSQKFVGQLEGVDKVDDDDDDDTSLNKNTRTAAEFAKVVWDVTAQNTKAPVSHEIIVMCMVLVWVTVISLISFGRSFSSQTKELIVGIIVTCNLLFFYGAPLSTIFLMLKTRSSDSIHRPTMITNTLNGIFWTAFGIAVLDYFISVPNGIGALLGGIQMLLCIIFPRNHYHQKENSLASNHISSITNDQAGDNR